MNIHSIWMKLLLRNNSDKGEKTLFFKVFTKSCFRKLKKLTFTPRMFAFRRRKLSILGACTERRLLKKSKNDVKRISLKNLSPTIASDGGKHDVILHFIGEK